MHSTNNFALHYFKQRTFIEYSFIYMYTYMGMYIIHALCNHWTHPLEIHTPYIFQWILNDFSITIKMKTKQKNGFMCICYYTVLQFVFINIEIGFNVSQCQWLDITRKYFNLYSYIHYNSSMHYQKLVAFCIFSWCWQN